MDGIVFSQTFTSSTLEHGFAGLWMETAALQRTLYLHHYCHNFELHLCTVEIVEVAEILFV
jgi:hypothetical protein